MDLRYALRVISLVMAAQATTLPAADPPVIPVGLDAYRMWDRWPYQRIGARAYMRSTYDRRGGNEGADASHFLYQLADDFNVTLDVEGPGVLYFARYNHWHGSPWHYVVDGTDHIVQETSTADPTHPRRTPTFLPARLFPNPLAWTWATTQGRRPDRGCRCRSSSRFAWPTRARTTARATTSISSSCPARTLSQPIRAWDGRTPPARTCWT